MHRDRSGEPRHTYNTRLRVKTERYKHYVLIERKGGAHKKIKKLNVEHERILVPRSVEIDRTRHDIPAKQ